MWERDAEKVKKSNKNNKKKLNPFDLYSWDIFLPRREA